MIIETSRLIIRKFAHSDSLDLFNIISDPEVMFYSIHGPYSLEETKEWLEKTISGYKHQSYAPYAIILKEKRTLIGFCGFSNHEIDGKNEIELGYRLAKKYWKQGFASEGESLELCK